MTSAASTPSAGLVAVPQADQLPGGVRIGPSPSAEASGNSTAFIVYARDSGALDRVVAHLRTVGLAPRDEWRTALFGVLVTLDETQMNELRGHADVLGVEPNRSVAAATNQTDPPWGLDRIDQRSLPLNSNFGYTATGAGVTAYVVDSGIRSSHREFVGRVAPGAYVDFGDFTGVEDCDGHGTHVSGTIGGTSYGVAKQVTIVPIKVLDCGGSGTNAGIIASIDWIINNHAASVPAVANMSLGGEASVAIDIAVQAMINDGISVVVAAGNGVPGIGAIDTCLVSPARLPAAITVAASEIDDNDAQYSNFGSCNDLFAPGSGILSAGILTDTDSTVLSGTSMASPHVAGAVALVLQGQPTFSPAQIASTIDATSTKDKIGVCCGDPNKLVYIGQLTAALSVTLAGTGSGSVTSALSGISCGATCNASFPSGTTVTLGAFPAGDSVFAGWSGACTGNAPTCAVTTTTAQSVVATFSLPSRALTVTRSGVGSGSVTSMPPGISCGAACTGVFPLGSVVTLTAVPASGSAFGGWSGACTGSTPSCAITMADAQNVAAVFTLVPPGFTALNPARFLDSRLGAPTVDGLFSGVGLRPAGSVTELPVAGRASVPADAPAVALNVTVTGAQRAGYVTVWPCGSPQPNASNINYEPGATLANSVIAKVGADGKVCIFTLAATDLIVDVNGFHPAGALFVPLIPGRMLESRIGAAPTADGRFSGIGVRAAGTITQLPIAGRYGVPANADTAVLNVTVTGTLSPGYVTVWPCGSAPPNASNVNYETNATVANSVIARIGADGSVCLYTSASTNLLVDLNGYYPMGSSLSSLIPARVLETRSGAAPTVDGQFSGIGRRAAGSVTDLAIAGRAGVPASAVAVVLNVTATGTQGSGYLTIWPCSSPQPTASNLNYPVNATVPNAVIAKLDATGRVCIYTSEATDLLVDINGYHTGP